MVVSSFENRLWNNEFTTNANANDLQLDIGRPACGESRIRSTDLILRGGSLNRYPLASTHL
jgi:hypothetical protein